MGDKDYGSDVSRYLDPEGRSFETVVYQEQKLVLDSELNLDQDVRALSRAESIRREIPSGFVTGDFLDDDLADYSFGTVPNTFHLDNAPVAAVNGWFFTLENSLGSSERGTATEPFDFSGGRSYDVEINGVQVTGTLTTANTSAADVATDFEAQIEADSSLSGGTVPTDDFEVRDNPDGSITVEASSTILFNDAGMTALEDELGLDIAAPSSGSNEITLPDPPTNQGEEVVDFVYLEVWRAMLAPEGASDEDANKPAADKLYPEGNVLARMDGWLDDDLKDTDPAINEETTRRVQIQHAIRVERLDSKSSRLGYGDVNVAAQGPNSAPTTESFSQQPDDPGLWVAGDDPGQAAAIPNTVDGRVYSIPICFVRRGNSDGFDFLNNGVGGALTSSGSSDRPDGKFADQIDLDDVQDMRSRVSPSGLDTSQILEQNVSLLMSQELRSWACDSAHTGWDAAGTNVGTRFLKADDMVPSTPVTDPASGNTFRRADGICRVFSDRSHVERHLVEFDASTWASGSNWAEGDVLTLDLEATSAIGAPIADEMPEDTMFVDVQSIVLDDTSGGGSPGQVEIPYDLVEGLGQTHSSGNLTVDVTLGEVPFSSSRDIWVVFEIAYPQGGGLTSHVTDPPSNYDFVVHNPSAFNSAINPSTPFTDDDAGRQAIRPYIHVEHEAPHRELRVEYHPDSAVTVQVYSQDDTTIILPERLYEDAVGTDSGVVSVTEDPGGSNTSHTVDAGNTSGRTVNLSTTLSSDGELVEVEFFPLRPLPINGATITFYYRTAGIQAVPDEFLPDPLDVRPVHESESLYVGTMSSGASETAYPWRAGLNQIPVIGDSGNALLDFEGEHDLDIPADISIDDFDASTGLLTLPALVPLARTSTIQFEGPLDVTTENQEFIDHYTSVDTSSYRPTSYAQNLSTFSRHKTFLPFIARLGQDTSFAREGTLVLVILSAYWDGEEENGVAFTDGDSRTCAAIYKLKGNPIAYGV